MLFVKTPEETLALIEREFSAVSGSELISLAAAMGRVLAEDITAAEYVPDFDRSTVDGYAVRARDTFGCTDAIPAILPLQGEVLMGEGAEFELNPEECVAVPTGGAIPRGADSVVMIEYTEDYGDGTIGVSKSAAPGQNMIFRGDDVFPGKPTILGKTGEKPLVGLPGHPVAAYFITKLFVLPLLSRLMGRKQEGYTTTARVTESISANHGRAQVHCCRLERREDGLWAAPIRCKSGLITTLAGSAGYFVIDRDCEGLPQGAQVQVTITSGE